MTNTVSYFILYSILYVYLLNIKTSLLFDTVFSNALLLRINRTFSNLNTPQKKRGGPVGFNNRIPRLLFLLILPFPPPPMQKDFLFSKSNNNSLYLPHKSLDSHHASSGPNGTRTSYSMHIQAVGLILVEKAHLTGFLDDYQAYGLDDLGCI